MERDTAENVNPEDQPNGTDFGLTSPSATLTFAQWCSAWELDCPTTPPANVPNATRPWTVAQWRNALAVVKAVGTSATHYAIARAELDDANLLAAVTALGNQDGLADLKDRLDASRVTMLTVKSGAATTDFSEAGEYATSSGLLVRNGAAMSVAVNDALDVAITGVTVASANGSTDSLNGLAFSGTNVLTTRGALATVTDAPIKFLLEQVAGMSLDDGASSGYRQIQGALAPLSSWLSTGQRDLDLARANLQQMGTNLPPLIENQTMSRSMGVVLGRLSSLKSTAVTRRQRFLSAEAAQTFRCLLPDSELTFDASFGIQSVARRSSTVTTVVVYGIKARPLSGLIRPTFYLTRIDLEPTRIVIYDVPVVGTKVIDMSGSSSIDLRCS